MGCAGRSGRIFGQPSFRIPDGAPGAARSEMDGAAGFEHRGGVQHAGGGGGGWGLAWRLGCIERDGLATQSVDDLRRGRRAAEGDHRTRVAREAYASEPSPMVDVFL